MKRRFFFLLMISLATILLLGCTKKKAYLSAIEDNTIEGYNLYLNNYPKGKHAENITFRLALKEGYADNFRKFLKDFPKSKFSVLASQKLDSLTTLKGVCVSVPITIGGLNDGITNPIQTILQKDNWLASLNSVYNISEGSNILKYRSEFVNAYQVAYNNCIGERYNVNDILNSDILFTKMITFYERLDSIKFGYEIMLLSKINFELRANTLKSEIDRYNSYRRDFVNNFNSFARSEKPINELFNPSFNKGMYLMDIENNIANLVIRIDFFSERIFGMNSISNYDCCTRFEYWSLLYEMINHKLRHPSIPLTIENQFLEKMDELYECKHAASHVLTDT